MLDSHQSAPSFSTVLQSLTLPEEENNPLVVTKHDYCLVPSGLLLQLLQQPTLFPNMHEVRSQSREDPIPGAAAKAFLQQRLSRSTDDMKHYSLHHHHNCPIIFCECLNHRGKMVLNAFGKHATPDGSCNPEEECLKFCSVFWLSPLEKLSLFLHMKRISFKPLQGMEISSFTPPSVELFLSVCTSQPPSYQSLLSTDTAMAKLFLPFFNLCACVPKTDPPPTVDVPLIVLGLVAIMALKSKPFPLLEPSHQLGIVSTVFGCLFDPSAFDHPAFGTSVNDYLQYSCILRHNNNTPWNPDREGFLSSLTSKISKIMTILNNPKAAESSKVRVDYCALKCEWSPLEILHRLSYVPPFSIYDDTFSQRCQALMADEDVHPSNFYNYRTTKPVSLSQARHLLVHVQCNPYAGYVIDCLQSAPPILPSFSYHNASKEHIFFTIIDGVLPHHVLEMFQGEYKSLKTNGPPLLPLIPSSLRHPFDVFPLEGGSNRSLFVGSLGFYEWVTAKRAAGFLRSTTLSRNQKSTVLESSPLLLHESYEFATSLILFACVTVTNSEKPLSVSFLWRMMVMVNILFGDTPDREITWTEAEAVASILDHSGIIVTGDMLRKLILSSNHKLDLQQLKQKKPKIFCDILTQTPSNYQRWTSWQPSSSMETYLQYKKMPHNNNHHSHNNGSVSSLFYALHVKHRAALDYQIRFIYYLFHPSSSTPTSHFWTDMVSINTQDLGSIIDCLYHNRLSCSPVIGRRASDNAYIQFRQSLFVPFLPSRDEATLPWMRFFYSKYHEDANSTSASQTIRTTVETLNGMRQKVKKQEELLLQPLSPQPIDEPSSPMYTPTLRSPSSSSSSSSSSSILPYDLADLTRIAQKLQDSRKQEEAHEDAPEAKRQRQQEENQDEDDCFPFELPDEEAPIDEENYGAETLV